MFTKIYHIHDICCGHATNTLDTIIELALKSGYKELFMTEHCPIDGHINFFRPSREAIHDLKKRIDQANIKHKGKLKIFFGYEAEYSKWNTQYFHNFINDPDCDFLIFGNHYLGDMWKHPRLVMNEATTKEDLDEYNENSQLALASGLFSLYAHPDIWLSAYKKWDDKAKWLTNQLIEQCLKYDVPMGFNANGLNLRRDGFNYPSQYFWAEVAKSKVKVIIEADAHRLEVMQPDWLQKTKDLAISYGLKNNLVDEIKIKFFHK